MKFYTEQHKYYCGVDLHARSLYVNIIDQKGKIVKHKNIDATPEAFLGIIKKYRKDIVVAVECNHPLAHKIGRAVYYMLKRKEVFNTERFLNKQLIQTGRA